MTNEARRVNFKSVFALFLDKELEKRGRTQQWLVAELGAGKSTVSQWMSGVKQPDGLKFDAVLRALGFEDIEHALRTLADYASRVKRGENAPAVERELRKSAHRAGKGKAWLARTGKRRGVSARDEPAAPSPPSPRRGA